MVPCVDSYMWWTRLQEHNHRRWLPAGIACRECSLFTFQCFCASVHVCVCPNAPQTAKVDGKRKKDSYTRHRNYTYECDWRQKNHFCWFLLSIQYSAFSVFSFQFFVSILTFYFIFVTNCVCIFGLQFSTVFFVHRQPRCRCCYCRRWSALLTSS